MIPKTEGQRALRAEYRHRYRISGPSLAALAALLFTAFIAAACAPVPRAFARPPMRFPLGPLRRAWLGAEYTWARLTNA